MSSRTPYPPAGFNRDDAAEYLSVSVRTLDDIQATGNLIPKRLGARRVYLREDLEEFLRQLPDWERQAKSKST